MTNTKNISITMAITVMTSFISPFVANSINIAIPSIHADFGGSQLQLNWVVTSYLLSAAACALPLGRLADIVGRKKMFTLGILLFSLTSLACSFAFSLYSLILFRLFQGIANAMIFGTSMAILTAVVPPEKRGKALGITTAATYVGLSLGPVLGGVICKYFNWRGIFLLAFIVGIFNLILALLKLQGEWKGAEGESFDTKGSILCTMGLALFLLGLSNLSSTPSYTYLFTLGIVFIFIFIRHQLSTKSPLIPMRIFIKNTTFTFSNLATFINYSATFAVGYLLSLYLQLVMGLDTTVSGFILLSQPIIMAILSPITGRLSDKVEPQILASLGMGLSTIGLFTFIFLSRDTPSVLVILNLFLIGIGFAFFASPNSNAVMSSVDKAHYAIASSTMGTMRILGQTLSMAIVSLITSLNIGKLDLNSSEYPIQLLLSSRIALIIFTILCFLGVFASLARGKRDTLILPKSS
jgi:EmrB/QacA subfamily drug resistance transporter